MISTVEALGGSEISIYLLKKNQLKIVIFFVKQIHLQTHTSKGFRKSETSLKLRLNLKDYKISDGNLHR